MHRITTLGLGMALGFALVAAGCAREGEKLTTSALKPVQSEPKAVQHAKPQQAAQPDAARRIYCAEMRKGWKPGDMPPTEEALSKRRADNIYCSG